ncbi:MAG: Fic family protein [Gammaproteobacteria bacterium]|jgi:Fic family protein|nr:Fic family protein [Gammaproteobacteria bacterium]
MITKLVKKSDAMKVPAKPPNIKDIPLTQQIYTSLIGSQGLLGATTEKGEYLHWDQLRVKQPRPFNLSAKQWWAATKVARKQIYKLLPFVDIHHKPFLLAIPYEITQKLYMLDRPILGSSLDQALIEESMVEEAISSSQLEGAATTRKVAKEMIRSRRKPRNRDEQMILNNYHAMQYIKEIKDEPLSIELILALHKIVTEKTLDNKKDEGKLRRTDEIEIIDIATNEVLHTPPKAKELQARLEKLCDFANEDEIKLAPHTGYESSKFHEMFMISPQKTFIHPIVRGIILHFMLAYDHPFVDGNGRTARALFYWYMARQGYAWFEIISISQVIKDAATQYGKAFLYTETDENDITYFIFHQIDVILKAWNKFIHHFSEQTKEINAIEQKLKAYKLNHRQLALLRYAISYPQAHLLIDEHKQSHRISYETARTDLLSLVKLGLLSKKEVGKAFIFIATEKLANLK